MSRINRREFLKTGAAIVSFPALAHACERSDRNSTKSEVAGTGKNPADNPSLFNLVLVADSHVRLGREDPQNLMYLVDMDGRTVFHEGDSDGHPDTFGRFDLRERHIDLSLVHFWFPTNLEAERILLEILRADHVGLFHLPIRLEGEAPETIAQVSQDYPDMFLLTDAGETRSFQN